MKDFIGEGIEERFQGLSVQLSVDCGVIDIGENRWQNDGSFIINLCVKLFNMSNKYQLIINIFISLFNYIICVSNYVNEKLFL